MFAQICLFCVSSMIMSVHGIVLGRMDVLACSPQVILLEVLLKLFILLLIFLFIELVPVLLLFLVVLLGFLFVYNNQIKYRNL
jgi:hypothetical protein